MSTAESGLQQQVHTLYRDITAGCMHGCANAFQLVAVLSVMGVIIWARKKRARKMSALPKPTR